MLLFHRNYISRHNLFIDAFMSSKNIELRVQPEKKESTCNNTFNLVNVLTGCAYLIYNFTIEFSNWNKLSKQYNVEHTEVLGNETISWVVNAQMEAQSQIVRLEEVCQYVSSLNMAFLSLLGLTGAYSILRFTLRQYKIVQQAFQCTDVGWFVKIVLLMVGTAIQSMVGLFLIVLLLPTSFLTCYTNVARYFCTIAISVMFVFFLYNVILAAILQPILCHKIQYSALQEVGRNCEVDVVRVNARKKYSDKKYGDSVEETARLNEVDLDDDDTV